MNKKTTLTGRIREQLELKGIKRGVFYKSIGINSQSLRNWELRKSIPSADIAIKMAEYFNVSVKWLITGEDDLAYSQDETELLNIFRKVDPRDQEELLDIARGKFERKIEREKRNIEDFSSLSGASA